MEHFRIRPPQPAFFGQKLPLLLALAAPLLGCTPAQAPATASAAERFPSYSPAEASLFGDSFAPELFGLERPVPVEEDQKFMRRVVAAEGVIPAKVSTVNRDTRGGVQYYSVVVTQQGPALAGETDSPTLTLSVPPQSPSHAWVASLDSRLVGKSLILFFKRYNDRGSVTLHWYIEPDTEQVRAAIGRARLISEVAS